MTVVCTKINLGLKGLNSKVRHNAKQKITQCNDDKAYSRINS